MAPRSAFAFVTHLAAGAATFAIVQRWLFSRSDLPVSLANEGWFLNSGVAVFTIATSVFVVATLMSLLSRQLPQMAARYVAIGAIVAMTMTLAMMGLGNVFPIVIAFGGGILFAAALAGSYVGHGVRGMCSGRRE